MDNIMDKNTIEIMERIITEREALRHENKELKEQLRQSNDVIDLLLGEDRENLDVYLRINRGG